jgi:hypothetical protein
VDLAYFCEVRFHEGKAQIGGASVVSAGQHGGACWAG